MAQWFKALAAVAEDVHSIPRIRGQSTATCNCSPIASGITDTPSQTQLHTHNNKIFKELKTQIIFLIEEKKDSIYFHCKLEKDITSQIQQQSFLCLETLFPMEENSNFLLATQV